MATDEAPPASSLRGRLSLALVGPLIVLFLLGGAAALGLAQFFANSVYDGWLFDSVNSLAQEVDASPHGPLVDMPASTERLFEWDVADRTYFRVAGERHGLIAGRADLPQANGDVDPYGGTLIADLLADIKARLLRSTPIAGRGALLYDAKLDGKEVRIASLELPAAAYGEIVHVQVAETTRKRRALARAILLSTLLPQLVLIVVAAATIRRAVIHGLSPLRAVAARVQARSHRELHPIADAGVPEEVRPLTAALNDLFERLDRSSQAQQRFIAEAAHQLRTPLTSIKLQTGEILRAQSLADAKPSLDALRGSADRAVRLSNQLLTLARAEHDVSADEPREHFDLAALVRDTGAEWAPRALQAGIEMHFSSVPEDSPVMVDGKPDLLREAIGNLIDNAIKYHGGPGAIQLRVLRTPRCVEVEDDGPGIAPELRDHMLRRFVRGAGGEGSGLGLPIAREIAEIHHGALTLETASGGDGLLVRMTFTA